MLDELYFLFMARSHTACFHVFISHLSYLSDYYRYIVMEVIVVLGGDFITMVLCSARQSRYINSTLAGLVVFICTSRLFQYCFVSMFSLGFDVIFPDDTTRQKEFHTFNIKALLHVRFVIQRQ